VILPADLSPLLISAATACVATIATFFVGLFAARLMYGTRGRLRRWIDGLLTLPLVLPPTVVGFFLLVIFGRRSLIGHALERIGITVVFSWPATVIASTVIAFPLMYRTTLGAFEQVNPTLLHAAHTLGASEWRVFRRVLLPLAAPGVLAGTVLAFARALGEFGATLMLAGNIPGRTQTMPIAIFAAAEAGDMRTAMIWVALIVILSLAIIRLLNQQDIARRAWKSRTDGPEKVPLETPALVPVPQTLAGSAEPSATLSIDVEKSLDTFNLRVSLEASRGAVGLLGASGAGKSMTLRLIAGVVTPDRGRIELNGRTLFDSNSGQHVSPARRRIGVVFQDYALFPHLTVEENVAFGLYGLPRERRQERARLQMDLMRIRELAHRFPTEISGGQRQRVAIARCMATEPDALLLDEPFAALDPHLRRQMEEQLRETLAGYNGVVVFVTHDMEEAFRFCSELLVLDGGRVIASGPRQQLFEHPRKVAVAKLTGCKNIVPARQAAPDRIAVESWECELSCSEASSSVTHAGYRSHQFLFQQDASGANTFPCWLVATSEAPHEMTIYLRLHRPPGDGDPPHLQADVPKEVWRSLSIQAQPWTITLDPARLLLLEA